MVLICIDFSVLQIQKGTINTVDNLDTGTVSTKLLQREGKKEMGNQFNRLHVSIPREPQSRGTYYTRSDLACRCTVTA